jgi:hypothetical protein
MAYLTIANSIQILKRVDGKKFENTKGTIYKKPIFFFSKYEENILLGLQELWKDPENFIDLYYAPIEKKDNLNYIFEGGKPAYHFDSACKKLNSSFTNFEIPQAIKEKGIETVQKFRKWFKQNMHLLEKPEIFSMRLFHAFNIEVNPKAIDFDNSGVREKENLNLKELEERIDGIIKNAGSFWHQNSDKQTIIRRFQKYTFLAYKRDEIHSNDTGLSDLELKGFLRLYDIDFKKPIKDLLVEYYRVKFNPNLQFEGRLLEQLGFRACKSCQGELGNKVYEDLQLETKDKTEKVNKSLNNDKSNSDDLKDILNGLGW